MGGRGALLISLTENLKNQFATDGYFILREFFSVIEIAELRDAAADVLSEATRGARGVGFDPWTKEPGDDINPNRVTYINDIFLMHEDSKRICARASWPESFATSTVRISTDFNPLQ